MSKYTQGVDQRYIDRFGRGSKFGAEDRARYDNFMSQVKGKNLNQDAAMEAYKGGKWGSHDQNRYDAIMKARTVSNPKPEPKPEPKPQPKPEPKPEPAKPNPVQQADDASTLATGGTGQTSDPSNYSNQRQTAYQRALATLNTQSERDMAVAKVAPTGVASDTGLGGRDFVDYFSNASKTPGTYDWSEKFGKKAQERIDDLDVTDTSAINTDINRSIQDSYDRAKTQNFFTFGDIMHKDYKPPTWENSAPEDVKAPDFEELAKRYKSKD